MKTRAEIEEAAYQEACDEVFEEMKNREKKKAKRRLRAEYNIERRAKKIDFYRSMGFMLMSKQPNPYKILAKGLLKEVCRWIVVVFRLVRASCKFIYTWVKLSLKGAKDK